MYKRQLWLACDMSEFLAWFECRARLSNGGLGPQVSAAVSDAQAVAVNKGGIGNMGSG